MPRNWRRVKRKTKRCIVCKKSIVGPCVIIFSTTLRPVDDRGTLQPGHDPIHFDCFDANKHLVPRTGLEPARAILETAALPLSYPGT